TLYLNDLIGPRGSFKTAHNRKQRIKNRIILFNTLDPLAGFAALRVVVVLLVFILALRKPGTSARYVRPGKRSAGSRLPLVPFYTHLACQGQADAVGDFMGLTSPMLPEDAYSDTKLTHGVGKA
ncbi:hypothetical protein ElyMa_005126200, partial [Elysia marginata]